MSNLGKTFAVFGLIYFSVHILAGYSYCLDNFCPGDREADWVFEYVDDEGKKFVVVDGNPMPVDQWKQSSSVTTDGRKQ